MVYFRDQIDTASYEYNEAKRRFDQAEKEYVDSKFDLQQKTEAKVSSSNSNLSANDVMFVLTDWSPDP